MSNYSELKFNSKGLQCEAALFMPQQAPAAIVICAPGFGALWQFGNSSAITAFPKAGYAIWHLTTVALVIAIFPDNLLIQTNN